MEFTWGSWNMPQSKAPWPLINPNLIPCSGPLVEVVNYFLQEWIECNHTALAYTVLRAVKATKRFSIWKIGLDHWQGNARDDPWQVVGWLVKNAATASATMTAYPEPP